MVIAIKRLSPVVHGRIIAPDAAFGLVSGLGICRQDFGDVKRRDAAGLVVVFVVLARPQKIEQPNLFVWLGLADGLGCGELSF